MHRRTFLGGAATALAAPILAPATALAAASGAPLLGGAFTGQSGHTARGRVRIERSESGLLFVLGADFYLDGAPAPSLGFSRAGAFLPHTEFAPLRALRGAQSYPLPAGIDLGAIDAATIWCADFSVPLGTAPLS